MSGKNKIMITILVGLILNIMVMPVLAETSSGLLDGKIFKGVLTIKAPTTQEVSIKEETVSPTDELITFKEGKLYSEAFKELGYEGCPYTAQKDLKGINFTVKCIKIDDPKSVLSWKGVVSTISSSGETSLIGTASFMEGATIVKEYAVNAQLETPKVPPQPEIVLQGTFGQTKDGCFFIATDKENIALQMPKMILPPENLGRAMTARGIWSMTDVLHCGMSKMLIVQTFEFTSELPTYPQDQ